MAMFESDDREDVNLNLIKGQEMKQNCPNSTRAKVVTTTGTQNRQPVFSRRVTVHTKSDSWREDGRKAGIQKLGHK